MRTWRRCLGRAGTEVVIDPCERVFRRTLRSLIFGSLGGKRHSIPSPLQSPESRRAAPLVAAEEVGDVLLGGDWVAHRPHHRPERPEVPSMPPSSHRGGSPASPQSEDSLADPDWRGGSFSLRQMKKRLNGKARLWAPQRGRRWSPEVGRKNAGWLPIGLEPTPLSRRGLPSRSVPPQPQVKSQRRCYPPPGPSTSGGRGGMAQQAVPVRVLLPQGQ